MKWTDTLEIAIALSEKYPDIDPLTVRFTDLFEWVQELDEFDDHPKHCGEKIVEAIQMAWIDEVKEGLSSPDPSAYAFDSASRFSKRRSWRSQISASSTYRSTESRG